MILQNRADIIRNRLQQTFSPTHLEVTDESDQHIGHAGHQGGGRHFSVVIASDCFNGLRRIEAHRRIYDLFIDMIPNQIHALRIKISRHAP